MTTSVDTSYGSWPATTPPFITKYGVVTNPSTSFSTGVVLDPYGAPPSLFINNEQGVWYDPSDFSTMFQDSAGTTPVTAVEQPVGLVLDKSKGLVLGPELVTNGTFDSGTAGWSAAITGSTIAAVGGELVLTEGGSQNPSADYNFGAIAGKTYKLTATIRKAGAATAVRITVNGGATILLESNSSTPVTWSGTFISTGTGTLRLYAIAAASSSGQGIFDNISVKELPGNHATQATAASRPILSARVNLLTYSEDFSNAAWQKQSSSVAGNVLSLPTAGTSQILQAVTANGSVKLSFTLSGSGTCSIYGYLAGYLGEIQVTLTATPTTYSTTFTAAGLTSFYVGRRVADSATQVTLHTASLVFADQATLPYQSITTATSYDTVGFPHYLKFDGVDDSLSTGTVDFTATDKMTVFAGVRKRSDAATGVIAELSATSANLGTFKISGPDSNGSGTYGFGLTGTTGCAVIADTLVAPRSSVLSASFDISKAGVSTEILPRVNGVIPSNTTFGTTAGTGNFGNYPLYIGRRGGTTLPFNGHLYSLIIRGAQSTDSQIVSAESYVNSKTGAY